MYVNINQSKIFFHKFSSCYKVSQRHIYLTLKRGIVGRGTRVKKPVGQIYWLLLWICFIRWFPCDIHNDKVPADWVGGGVPNLLVLAPIQVDATLSPILAVEAGKVGLVDYWHFELLELLSGIYRLSFCRQYVEKSNFFFWKSHLGLP